MLRWGLVGLSVAAAIYYGLTLGLSASVPGLLCAYFAATTPPERVETTPPSRGIDASAVEASAVEASAVTPSAVKAYRVAHPGVGILAAADALQRDA